MKQILIKFDDGISAEEALQKALDVVCIGRIAKYGTAYCPATVYDRDKIAVYCPERTKHLVFKVKNIPPVPETIYGNGGAVTWNCITETK